MAARSVQLTRRALSCAAAGAGHTTLASPAGPPKQQACGERPAPAWPPSAPKCWQPPGSLLLW
eukprot:7048958-Prymnesium_polylepis.1